MTQKTSLGKYSSALRPSRFNLVIELGKKIVLYFEVLTFTKNFRNF